MKTITTILACVAAGTAALGTAAYALFTIPTSQLASKTPAAKVEAPAPAPQRLSDETFWANQDLLLVKRCERTVRAQLKDPSSYRYVTHNLLPWGSEASMTVVYSATNDFGGRVQEQHVCRYNRTAA